MSDPDAALVRDYLRSIASHPLLDHQEQAQAIEAIHRGQEAAAELEASGGLPAEHTAKLRRALADADTAKVTLTKANLRLVVSVAKRYQGRGVPVIDLIQEGNLGLMKGIERLDERTNVPFAAHATWWIRDAVTRALPGSES